MVSNCISEIHSFILARLDVLIVLLCGFPQVRNTLSSSYCGLLSSSLVKIEAVCSCETLPLTYHVLQCQPRRLSGLMLWFSEFLHPCSQEANIRPQLFCSMSFLIHYALYYHICHIFLSAGITVR